MAAAKSAAASVMSLYVGNQTGQVSGVFLPVGVYFWWLRGAFLNVSTRPIKQNSPPAFYRHSSIIGDIPVMRHIMMLLLRRYYSKSGRMMIICLLIRLRRRETMIMHFGDWQL